jgi:hypothetical protein
MMGDNHLHIDRQDQLIDGLVKSLKAAAGGTIKIDLDDQPAVRIDLNNDQIMVDLLQPTFFKTPEDETGLFDKWNNQNMNQNIEWRSIRRRQKEIVAILKIEKSMLTVDLLYRRHQAKNNIKRYIDERLPEEYEKCLVGLTAILREG